MDDSGSGYNKSMNDNTYKSLNVDEPRVDDSSIKVKTGRLGITKFMGIAFPPPP